MRFQPAGWVTLARTILLHENVVGLSGFPGPLAKQNEDWETCSYNFPSESYPLIDPWGAIIGSRIAWLPDELQVTEEGYAQQCCKWTSDVDAGFVEPVASWYKNHQNNQYYTGCH